MYKKNNRYKILTPNGYVNFDGINTINKNQYIEIKTINSKLKCSLNHKIYMDNDIAVEAVNIKLGDYIQTAYGLEKIIYKELINDEILLYDPVNVNNNNNSYYSNDIISHNCEFLGSTNTVISPDVMEYLFTQYESPIHTDMNERFRIFEKPERGCRYTIGCDVAKGTGEHDSVCQVLKFISLDPIKFEQVAVFQNNFTDVYSFSDIINRISIYYNNAYIMVENNAEGAAVVNKLWWDIETENLVNTGAKAVNLGIRATKNTKPKAVLLMKKVIEDNCLKIRDKETVEQLASFIEQNGKFFGKDLGDDLISALYWAVYVTQMDVFDETISLKTGNDGESEEEIWGVLSDIHSEEENDFKWLDDILS